MWRKDDVLANVDFVKNPCARLPPRCWGGFSSRQPPQHQRSVGAAEAERVGEHGVDWSLLRLVRHEIDGGLNRGVVEVERRRGDVIADGEHRIDRLYGARRA